MAIDQIKIDNWFRYHRVTEEQRKPYEAIRNAAKQFSQVILQNTPQCADQSDAIRKVREAMLISHSSISCSGR